MSEIEKAQFTTGHARHARQRTEKTELLVKRWIRQEAATSLRDALSGELGVSPITTNVLINRGIKTKEEAEVLLRGSLDDLVEPFLLDGMDRVVARVALAIRRNEKICVFGDYDADGITATALLVDFFRDLGRDVSYYIPGRLEEGYGISLRALREIRDGGTDLVITVDCGISSAEEVEAAKAMGLDVIITDHHEPPEVIPDTWVLNPCLRGSTYPFTGLAGVGVALKLAQAVKAGLDGKDRAGAGVEPDMRKYLDLVALGTVADVVPLKGENRILVKHGLELLRDPRRVGIRKLKEIASIREGSVTAGTVGYQLAPRLNASGRLGKANVGVRLLITDDPAEAVSIALDLDTMNRERQKIEEDILEEARSIINSEMDMDDCRTIVLASERWHQGVIGIVASKLVEEYFRPTVLISLTGGAGKGSARSIPAFHLYEGLEKCSAHLDAFGGHKYAAGLSIKCERLPAFRTQFEGLVRETLTKDDFMPALRIDAQLRLGQADWKLYNELASLAPFGAGNPEPVLESRGLEVHFPKVVGRNHVRMRMAQDGCYVGSIGFNMGNCYQSLAMGRVVLDAAFCLEANEWQGERRLQLNLKDLHF